jgi:lysophospholipase L1-like esterase
MARSRRRVAVFVIAIGVSAFAAAEALCRFAEGTTDAFVGPYESGGTDGEIGFAAGGRLDHGVVTTFNAGAYVGPLKPRTPAPGMTRVLVLGDSFTFGWAIGPELAWPALLDDALGSDVEVLNFAVPGQNTWLELEHYRRNARAWNADLVLLGWFANDAAIDRRSPNVHRLCPLPAGASRPWATAMEHLAVARVLSDLWNIADHGGPLPSWDSESVIHEDVFGFACSMHWLLELKGEVEADGARFAVVQMPQLDGLQSQQDPEQEAQERLAAALERRGIDRFELYDALSGNPPDRMQADDFHPSAEANRLIAASLAPRVAMLLADTLGP